MTITYSGTKRIKSLKAVKKVALNLTNPTTGQIICSDGKNYDANAMLPTGVTKVAMIAYVVGKNGLAIQLNSTPVEKNWAGAIAYAEGLNTSIPFDGGTWRMPSKANWQTMIYGCSKNGDSSPSDRMNTIVGFKEKVAATGTTLHSNLHWTSTENSSVCFGLNDGDSYAYFYNTGPASYEYKVLGCLVF